MPRDIERTKLVGLVGAYETVLADLVEGQTIEAGHGLVFAFLQAMEGFIRAVTTDYRTALEAAGAPRAKPANPGAGAKRVDFETAEIKNLWCAECGWPVVFVCCNGDFGDWAYPWDWWCYCSNKACPNHGGEGKDQAYPEWVREDDTESCRHTCSDGKNGGGNGECLACGERDCPEHEPLHYHHDGCPSCDGPAVPGVPVGPDDDFWVVEDIVPGQDFGKMLSPSAGRREKP